MVMTVQSMVGLQVTCRHILSSERWREGAGAVNGMPVSPQSCTWKLRPQRDGVTGGALGRCLGLTEARRVAP